MPLYSTGPPIRSRSIAEIARGKLHEYSALHNIPHNPYAYGSLRHLFRTSSIRRRDSAEQRHLKSEAERKLTKEEEKKIEQEIDKDVERKMKQPIETDSEGLEI